jgi:hypothetical protein
LYSILTPAGLKVIPVEKKSLFGSYQVAGVEPSKLADIISGIVPVDNSALMAKLKQLIELVDKYLALKAKRNSQGARPIATPAIPESKLNISQSLIIKLIFLNIILNRFTSLPFLSKLSL